MNTLNKKALIYAGMSMLIAMLAAGFGPARAQAATEAGCSEALLPDGTEIRVRLLETISSASAKEHQPLILETVDDVIVDGNVVIWRAARAEGAIVRAERRHGFGRRGKLAVSVGRAQAVDGTMLPLGSETSFRGKDRYSKAAVVTLIAGPFGILVKGKNIEIPAGTELSAYVRGDRMVQIAPDGCSAAEASIAVQGVRGLR